MSDRGKQIDRTTVRFERMLPGPIERVWDYLTDGKKRGEWFAGGVTELKVGGKAEFLFDHRNLTPADDKPPKKHEKNAGEMRFEGRVVKAEPPRLLIWEWPSEGEGGAMSEVTFALEKKGDKVMLTLTETRLPKRENVVGNASGWHIHLDLLEAKLAGKAPPRFWATIVKYEDDYDRSFARG